MQKNREQFICLFSVFFAPEGFEFSLKIPNFINIPQDTLITSYSCANPQSSGLFNSLDWFTIQYNSKNINIFGILKVIYENFAVKIPKIKKNRILVLTTKYESGILESMKDKQFGSEKAIQK